MQADILVLGGGLAGAQLVHSLRNDGFAGTILVVSDEEHPPYHRPPLSKAYLEGTTSTDKLWIRDREYYRANGIDLVLEAEAMALDRSARAVHLRDGRIIGYRKLVLATGARNRQLPAIAPGVQILYVRTVSESSALRSQAADARSVVIVGGGFLGLEIAHALNKSGKAVTVLELAPRVLARTSSPVISEAIRAMHSATGIRIICGDAVTDVRSASSGVTIALASGTDVVVDLLVACVGVVPNVELAAAAGLATDNGIVVDDCLATSDPDIFAIGDCARFPSRFGTAPLRLESVQNAIEQARCLASSFASGRSKPFDAVPWFWSDQGVKLQIAGIVPTAGDFRVKGDPASLRFSVYGFRDRRLVSVESIGVPADHMAARKLLASGSQLSPEDLEGDAAGVKP